MTVVSEEKQVKISAYDRLLNIMQEGKADCKQKPKGQNVWAKKIGDIFSNACGSSSRSKARVRIYDSEKPKKSMEQKYRPTSPQLNKSPSCDQVTKVHAKGSRQQGRGRKSKKQSSKGAKRHFNVSFSLSGIFRRRTTGFSISKWRDVKKVNANADTNVNGSKGLDLKPIYGRIKRAKHMIKREVILIQDEKTKKKKKTKHDKKECEAEEVTGELELCKKRILMGEKCRPLNKSGALHYDHEGILLPEDFLPSEEPLVETSD